MGASCDVLDLGVGPQCWGVQGLPIGSIVVPFWDYLNYRILNTNHKKELLWRLWAGTSGFLGVVGL